MYIDGNKPIRTTQFRIKNSGSSVLKYSTVKNITIKDRAIIVGK